MCADLYFMEVDVPHKSNNKVEHAGFVRRGRVLHGD